MSEQLGEPTGRENGIRESEIEAYEQLERAFNEIKAISAEIASQKFASKDALRSALHQFYDDKIRTLHQIHSELTRVPLVISGNGIERAVVQMGERDGQPHPEGIMIYFNRQEPFSLVDDFESSEFCFSRLAFKPEETADGQFQARAFIIGQPPEQCVDFIEDDDTFSFLSVTAFSAIRIDCSQSDSPLEIVALRADRERQNALLDLEMELEAGDTSTLGLMDELHGALQCSEGQRYANFENLDLLHKIGELGKSYAANNPRLSNALTVAIAKTFGKDSHILFDGKAYLLGQNYQDEPEVCNNIAGGVISVLDDVPRNPSSEPTGPLLVIQLDDTPDGKSVEIGIPLTDVTRLMV